MFVICPFQYAAIGHYALRRCWPHAYASSLVALYVYCAWEWRSSVLAFWSVKIPTRRLARTRCVK